MKRIISLLLTLIMLCSMFVVVNAANNLAGAKDYTLGTEVSGKITESRSIMGW